MSTWTTKLEEDHHSHQHLFAATSAVSAADAALSAANAHPSAADKGGRVKKLNKDGMAIILDFLNKNNGGELRITRPQAQQVATEVRDKTGYEEITAAKVQDWVKRKRQAASKSKVAVPPTAPSSSVSSSASSTSPGFMFNFRHWTHVPVPGATASASSIQNEPLTAAKIQILENLISQCTNGVDDAMISTWANAFTVDRDLVKSLVQKRTPPLPPTPVSPSLPNRLSWLLPDSRPFADRIAQINVDTHPRLPTPADTISSAGSPAVSHATVPQKPQSSSAASPRSYRSPTPLPPPPTTSISTSSEIMNVDSDPFIQPPPALVDPDTRYIDPIVKGIIEGVKGAVRAPPSAPAVLPRTTAELNALWAPFETKLNQLAESLA